jgi:hypothetical protein
MIDGAHGGDIEVGSTLGKGIAFRVRLPLLIIGGPVRFVGRELCGCARKGWRFQLILSIAL